MQEQDFPQEAAAGSKEPGVKEGEWPVTALRGLLDPTALAAAHLVLSVGKNAVGSAPLVPLEHEEQVEVIPGH